MTKINVNKRADNRRYVLDELPKQQTKKTGKQGN